MRTRILPQPQANGFALPAVILLSAALLLLLVTLMTIVDLERNSSRARVGAYRAELAADSAFEEAKSLLAAAASNDSFAVGVVPFAAEFDDNGDGVISSVEDGDLSAEDGERGRPYLYAIQGDINGGALDYRFLPLFATTHGPGRQRVQADGTLEVPDDPGLPQGGETMGNLDSRVAVTGPPHLQPPVTAWRMMYDQEGEPMARYSYWVEDTQGYLDADYAPGNSLSGGHVRANEIASNTSYWQASLRNEAAQYYSDGGQVPLWPAPGLNPGYREEAPGFFTPSHRLLNQIAIHTLDQNGDGLKDVTQFDDLVRSQASKAPTPGSLLALLGAQAPLQRVASGVDRGRLELTGAANGVENRWVEENIITGNRGWEEQALIPHVPGLDAAVMGTPRKNLNLLLRSAATGAVGGVLAQGEMAVGEMADFIERALPDFAEERQGGFPEDYLRTLAASAFDYADNDDIPHVKEGVYRGVDSHPLISEFVTTTTWQWTDHPDDEPGSGQEFLGKSFLRVNGDLYILMTVEIFAELWNMSNHRIEGTAEFAYENNYSFPVLGNPGVTFMGNVLANTGGPNGDSFSSHELVEHADGYFYSPPRNIILEPNEHRLVRAAVVRYGFYVGDEDQFVPEPIPTIDGDEGNSQYRLRWNGVLCDRAAGGLERVAMTKLDTKAPQSKAVICGTWGPYGAFYTGMQDVRQSWWAGVNDSFPEGIVSENSYPQNYTPGRRNVRYGSIGNSPDAPYGRVLPSEWPDGGHDASFDLDSFKANDSQDRSIRPDAPNFVQMKLPADPDTAPMFVSNLGRFISETELGNVFDPIMWKGRDNPGQSIETWYYRENNDGGEPEVSNRASEANHVGGGNTLRIGRPEHEKFAREPGTRASRLLDLFHCGVPLSDDENKRVGNKRQIEGHININTAPRDVLRALAAGVLAADPLIGLEASFDTRNSFAPRLVRMAGEVSAAEVGNRSEGFSDEAGYLADAIIAGRPYVSLSQLADLAYPLDHPNTTLRGQPVFGNKLNHRIGERLQRTDRAAEEVFARVYNSSTVRSRNFRIHVIGQALQKTPSGNLRVRGTRKKSFRVFVDAGARTASGSINPSNLKIETLYETNL
ncbi:hypothetical protein [Roseibacillus ishigakijimensis]|uniref:Uncharacterized protein n=1 Tax=Roseibacillus ishigakijimensis TaxID=454146 RepID=A0A934RP97_9BACT|nr:hypothetical protein [Roseibacillus ishigakijimensis]MBK1833322.1 hypothetical protein [Roseibacillus ishigakijimensis]